MEVLTLPIRKTSTCLTLSSRGALMLGSRALT
jgi:hypothetical protein